MLRSIDGADNELLQEIAKSLDTVAQNAPLSQSALERIRTECSLLADRAQRLHVLLGAARESKAVLLEAYYLREFQDTVITLFRLRAIGAPDIPLEACVEAIRSHDSRRLPFTLELFEAVLPQEEKDTIYPLIELSLGRGQQPAGPAGLAIRDTLLDEARQGVYSTDQWYSVICLDYVCRCVGDQIESGVDWNRVPVTEAHREVLHHRGRSQGVAFSAAVRKRFDLAGGRFAMYSILEKTVLLRSTDPFREIPAKLLSRVAQVCEEVSLPAGTRLFRTGDLGDSLYVIGAGKVRIHRGDLPLAVLEREASFGETALLDQEPRSADATIDDDATLFRIDHDDFFELLTTRPEIARSVIQQLSSRLRAANEKLTTLSQSAQ